MALLEGIGFGTPENMQTRLSYLAESMDILAARFAGYDMVYTPAPNAPGETYFPWYGRDDEEIMVCVFRGGRIEESFHRQDFFFFNYAWRGDYDTLSFQRDNLVTIREGELYLGQPFTGYALRGNLREEVTIVGVLIRKETFYESFMPMAAGTRLLDFFVDPLTNPSAEQFMVLHPDRDFPAAELLSFMICEYAHERPDSQDLLKSYALLLIMHAARQYDREHDVPEPKGECAKMLAHLERNVGQVSLAQLAAQFGYHPNYLSTLFKKELGRSFTELVLEQRMSRAAVLLRGTTSPIEIIALQLGYSNPSNFYKAFERYYGCTPREFRLRRSVDIAR